jgi:hypothetical protein
MQDYPLAIKAKPPRVLQRDVYGGSLLEGMQGFDLASYDFDAIQQDIDNAMAGMDSMMDNPMMKNFKNLTGSMGLSSNISETIGEIKDMSKSLEDDVDSIKEETKDLSIQMESNLVYAYITCKDSSGGNYLTFLRYKVGEDTKKPVMTGHDTSKGEAYFNEPVECFIDGEELSCDNNIEERYMCQDDRLKDGANIRCVDNVPERQSFNVKVLKTNNTGIRGSEFGFMGNMFLNNGVLNVYDNSQDAVVEINSSSVILNITTDKRCYNYEEALRCDGSYCVKQLHQGNYSVSCVEDVGERHEAEFVLG